jgi:hypothetical protein
MDTMRHDLRDALDEVRPEAIPATVAVAAEERSCGDSRICTKCGYPPAHKDKLRYCGRCAVVHYCSKQCAREHWPEHKLVCESSREARAEALTDYEARGGRIQDYKQMQRDAVSWFRAVPGLNNEIKLLAWAHRSESPLIRTIATSQSDADGSDIRVEMIPRSFWDEDPRSHETYTDSAQNQLREFYDCASNRKTGFMYAFETTYPDGKSNVSMVTSSSFDDKLIRGAEIAEALTTATKAEDLAAAFAWFENTYPSEAAHGTEQWIRNRAVSVHGDSNTTVQGLVLDPSRALNNEVAYMIFGCMQLEFDVHLTGLRSATHLNGRQGIIRGPEPESHDRWKVRLDDSTYVSVKAVNLAHIRRGDYKRRSP